MSGCDAGGKSVEWEFLLLLLLLIMVSNIKHPNGHRGDQRYCPTAPPPKRVRKAVQRCARSRRRIPGSHTGVKLLLGTRIRQITHDHINLQPYLTNADMYDVCSLREISRMLTANTWTWKRSTARSYRYLTVLLRRRSFVITRSVLFCFWDEYINQKLTPNHYIFISLG